MKDQETKEKFIELRGVQGLSYDKIAAKLKTTKQTLITWARELDIEISNLKQIRLDALREQYFLTKENQIELLGGELKKIKDELGGRNLEEIPTVKLFYLLLKFSQALKEEASGPVFSIKEAALGVFDDMTSVKSWEG